MQDNLHDSLNNFSEPVEQRELETVDLQSVDIEETLESRSNTEEESIPFASPDDTKCFEERAL